MSLTADRIGDLTYVRANTRAIKASSMIPDSDDFMSVDSSDCTD